MSKLKIQETEIFVGKEPDVKQKQSTVQDILNALAEKGLIEQGATIIKQTDTPLMALIIEIKPRLSSKNLQETLSLPLVSQRTQIEIIAALINQALNKNPPKGLETNLLKRVTPKKRRN